MVQWIIDLVDLWHQHKGEIMKSFLKKLGAALANFAKTDVPILSSIGAIIQPFLGSGKVAQVVSTGVNDLTALAQAGLQIETAMQGKPGAEKLAALVPLAGTIVKTSEVVAGKKIANEALFTQAVQEFAQATVDLLNSIDESAVPAA